MTHLEPFDRITAAFRPTRTDDLKPGVAQCIGMVAEWQALWIIEEGPYRGRCAMLCYDRARWPFGWVPDCDLEVVPEG